MDAFWDRLSSGQIIAVISIVVSGIVAVVMILSIVKYHLQALADETALQRQRLQIAASLKETIIEHAAKSGVSAEALLALDLTLPESEALSDHKDDRRLDVELAKRIGMLETSRDEIEHVLTLAIALDPARKKVIVDALDELFESGADHGPIVAAVRGLCHNPRAKEAEASSAVAAS